MSTDGMYLEHYPVKEAQKFVDYMETAIETDAIIFTADAMIVADCRAWATMAERDELTRYERADGRWAAVFRLTLQQRVFFAVQHEQLSNGSLKR